MEDRGLRIDAPGTSLTWRVDGGDLVRELVAAAADGRPIVRRYRLRPGGVRLDADLSTEATAGGWLVRWRLGEAPEGWSGTAYVPAARGGGR